MSAVACPEEGVPGGSYRSAREQHGGWRMWAGGTLAWLDRDSLDPTGWAPLCPRLRAPGHRRWHTAGLGCLLVEPAVAREAAVVRSAGARKTSPFVLPAVGETPGNWGLGSAPASLSPGSHDTSGCRQCCLGGRARGRGPRARPGATHPHSPGQSSLRLSRVAPHPVPGRWGPPCPVLSGWARSGPPRPYLGPAQPCPPCPVPSDCTAQPHSPFTRRPAPPPVQRSPLSSWTQALTTAALGPKGSAETPPSSWERVGSSRRVGNPRPHPQAGAGVTARRELFRLIPEAWARYGGGGGV